MRFRRNTELTEDDLLTFVAGEADTALKKRIAAEMEKDGSFAQTWLRRLQTAAANPVDVDWAALLQHGRTAENAELEEEVEETEKPETARSRVVALSCGKFQVIDTLDVGAHSTLLHVRRTTDFRDYALKVIPINSSHARRYLVQAQHEFRVSQMLDHNNLIKIYALEKIKDWLFRIRKAFLLIEYVNGKTLDTCPPLRLPILVQVFNCVAAGLVHMHRRKVYHANLEPNKIMISRSGDVKIIDYGVATIHGEGKDRIQGTPEYISPEQAMHKMVNERTDIYSFGATMYRMVTLRLPPSTLQPEGSLPIDAETWKRMFEPVQVFNQQAPPELCDLIHRCLSFDANQRPERMSEVQSVLDLLADKMITSPEDRLKASER
jgi:serine/threonine protein kinase